MRFRPIHILQFLAIYIPLEDTLLMALPLPGPLYALGKVFTELVILGLLAMVVYQRAISGRRLKWVGIESLLVLFVAGAVVAVFLNGASWFPALMNMRALLRYMALCFLIAQLSLTPADIDRLLRWMVVSALLQVSFSLIQVSVPPLDQLLRRWREATAVEMAGFKKTVAVEKIGAATGTFFNAISVAMFLCIAITIVMVRRYTISARWRGRDAAVLLFLLLGVYLTYKRGPLLLAGFGVFLIPFIFGGKKIRARLLFGGGLAGLILAALVFLGVGMGAKTEKLTSLQLRQEGVGDAFSYISELASSEYWSASSKASRGWVIIEVGGALVRQPNVFGYSPDVETAKKRLVEKNPFLVRLLEYTPLEDVYWVSIWLYYGPWGLLIWLALMHRLFRLGKRLSTESFSAGDIALGRILQVFIAMALISAMAYATFEFRGFSFYLWMLAGMTIARLRAARFTNSPLYRSEASS
jgi:hypothetical protein